MTDAKGSNLVVSKELDYRKIAAAHPSYRYSRVLPNTGQQSVALAAASSPETVFEIPVKVFNPARTQLTGYINPGTADANYWFWLFADVVPVQQIQAYTKGGVYIADVNYANNYVKGVRKAFTRFDDYMSNDPVDLLFKSDTIGGADTPTGVRPDNTAAVVPYLEPARTIVGLQAAATASDPQVLFQIPLSAFKESFFALDKDVYFGETIYIRIVWAPSSKIMWESKSQTNPNSTPLAVPANSQPTIQNLALQLAVEMNQEICNGWVKNVEQGIEILIPYVYAFKNTLSTTSQSVQVKMNRGHGRALKRVLHTVWNNTENTNTTAFDCSNVNAAKVASYYTSVDSQRTTESDIQCTLTASTNLAQTDWMYHKELLKGTVLGMNSLTYQYDNVFIDDFSFGSERKLTVPIDNVIGGLSLGQAEVQWNIYMTTTNATYNHYTWAITQRMLNIKKDAITVN